MLGSSASLVALFQPWVHGAWRPDFGCDACTPFDRYIFGPWPPPPPLQPDYLRLAWLLVPAALAFACGCVAIPRPRPESRLIRVAILAIGFTSAVVGLAFTGLMAWLLQFTDSAARMSVASGAYLSAIGYVLIFVGASVYVASGKPIPAGTQRAE